MSASIYDVKIQKEKAVCAFQTKSTTVRPLRCHMIAQVATHVAWVKAAVLGGRVLYTLGDGVGVARTGH